MCFLGLGSMGAGWMGGHRSSAGEWLAGTAGMVGHGRA
jgi:hypothetical protein